MSEHGRAWWAWARSCLCVPGLLCVHDVSVCLCLGMGRLVSWNGLFRSVFGVVLDEIMVGRIECYGVFAQYRFRCVLGELGRFRKEPGFRERVPGTGSG